MTASAADVEWTLDDAARRVGCSVETLRRRIRAGALAARRGPHGAYLVRRADLDRVHVESRPANVARLTDDESWAAVERLIHRFRWTRDRCLELLREYRRYGHRATRPGRIVEVARLRLSGYTYAQIGAMTGVSARQARRLGHRDVEAALRYEPARRDRITAKAARQPNPFLPKHTDPNGR